MKPASLCFTLFGDYFRDLSSEIWVGSLIRLLEAFDVSANSTRVTLSRMAQQDLITSRRVGQKSYYRLSDKGQRRILDGVTRVYDWKDERWDRHWQIVHCDVGDVAKDIRDKVENELQWMGFGQLNRTTWIGAHDRYRQLQPMIKEYGIDDVTHVFTSVYEGPRSALELVAEAWDLESIEESYRLFLEEFGPKYQGIYQKSLQDELLPEEAFVERTRLVHEYRKFLFIDPRLPSELLPPSWIGEQARKMFKDFHELLTPLAESFFYTHSEFAGQEQTYR